MRPTNTNDMTLVARLRELLRLMRRLHVSPADALELLTSQLRAFDEADRLERDLQHVDYPEWLYCQEPCDTTSIRRGEVKP